MKALAYTLVTETTFPEGRHGETESHSQNHHIQPSLCSPNLWPAMEFRFKVNGDEVKDTAKPAPTSN